MTRIVTSTYRYKRPPRKRKAVPLEVPAVVRARQVGPLELHDGPNVLSAHPTAHTEAPADDARKPAIVTAKKPRGRKSAVVDNDAETPESVKAFLARMIRPGGPLPPDVSE